MSKPKAVYPDTIHDPGLRAKVKQMESQFEGYRQQAVASLQTINSHFRGEYGVLYQERTNMLNALNTDTRLAGQITQIDALLSKEAVKLEAYFKKLKKDLPALQARVDKVQVKTAKKTFTDPMKKEAKTIIDGLIARIPTVLADIRDGKKELAVLKTEITAHQTRLAADLTKLTDSNGQFFKWIHQVGVWSKVLSVPNNAITIAEIDTQQLRDMQGHVASLANWIGHEKQTWADIKAHEADLNGIVTNVQGKVSKHENRFKKLMNEMQQIKLTGKTLERIFTAAKV